MPQVQQGGYLDYAGAKFLWDSALQRAAQDDKLELLMADFIPGTTQRISFRNNDVEYISHVDANNASIRTDDFTFGNNAITEVRRLPATGESLTIVTNMSTLETQITYSES